jgi:UDP-N-acetylglucosamine 2-epimerase (non-hydrolysing)
MIFLHVLGARPNFMKAAPVIRALSACPNVRQVLVHTGQHYDFNMSDVFFEQLDMPAPDVNLQVGSGSHAKQTAEIMMRLEPVVLEHKPDYVIVYGDVNSTVAAALVCSKLGIKVVHVEAGLRSFDRTMPEEINRLVTDSLADVLLTPSEDGNRNLLREGVSKDKIHLVGNVMIDTLIRMLPAAAKFLPSELPERFVLVTLHRPSNVDDPAWLKSMLDSLQSLADRAEVIFPVHPRTHKRLSEIGLNGNQPHLRLTEPLPYLSFLALQQKATVVITDSGGIQEETTYLGVPCLTVRENTERPITIDLGTNLLVGRDIKKISETANAIISGKQKQGSIPPLWDGHAAERIARLLTT